ncbi:Short C-terminal domain-containing protein [Halorubrum xinjiangense]|uniref:Short C-terminal domain-containing protein n=1 Tax=Halorubrum xinjiangense TaxID=261291 RepID=A0A1G7J179_9EURY|nr:SHOCT domain-containing protein [Halorubrum xinjiangense]SDF18643.1 Short C-terminal domain-containing protein [Halorubrum xinjiangense]
MALPTFEKNRLIGLIGILSFGLTSLFAVIIPGPLEALIPATFIAGFFILIPLVLVLGEDFPLVASDDPDASTEIGASADRPIAALRERYATGEIDEAEFERKLDRLLATEDLDERFDRVESGRIGDSRERDLELE